jgi:hypothetical protein
LPPTHTCPTEGLTGLALYAGAAGRSFTTICASAAEKDKAIASSITILEM